MIDQVNIARLRLINQHIGNSKFRTVKELVGWMGAMQAQDFPMAKWAVGVRLPGFSEADVETAFNNGDILRTHLLRPTWHFVSADDIYWMLALTAPQIKAVTNTRHQQLGLTAAIISKAIGAFAKALQGGKQLSRAELVAELERAGITTGENRASHLLAAAELEGILCSGRIVKGKPAYALLEERIPKHPPLTRNEALAKLARKYYSSHGPATLGDFTWWSGLSASDARRALEMVKSEFVLVEIDSQPYWLPEYLSNQKLEPHGAFLLPAYDEFIISYKDRRAILPAEHQGGTISSNGIFRPVVVVDGQVAGLWRRTIKRDQLLVELELFRPVDSAVVALIEGAARQYQGFTGVNGLQLMRTSM